MPSDWKARWTALSRKATWPLAYSVAPRILVGLKFLAMARLLGPQEFGLYALAFLWLTVMEGISDFGFRPAIVQSRDDLSDRQLGQINTVQLVRGLALIPLVAGAAWLARGYLGMGFSTCLRINGWKKLCNLKGVSTAWCNDILNSLTVQELGYKFETV